MIHPRSHSPNTRLKKIACGVPAAALMLGASSGATIGFNFQCNYCAAGSYSGATVTAAAFGIGTNAWESLSQMNTGYGCAGPATYYTLTEVVDTTTSGGGLNPLPNGSITVTWSAYTANASGFGGYGRPGPHYTFGGNGYNPGNEQVYWGFLRDGVNFGPGSSGGDNNQPGYVIDLVGLKSLFTNSAFAVQLIASADSMQYLTNAFIVDAMAGTTQSVVYPSTPPVADVGDTTWIRGIGGGLSTVSGPVNTDHLQIIGNRAAHAGNKTTGYNFASTIAGFILTDEPIISMPPNPVVAAGGDTMILSACAAGVTPLTYQWRQNGRAITGATMPSYTNAHPNVADAGAYDVVVSNQYGAVTSAVATVSVDHISATAGNNFVVDSNPNNTEHDGRAWGATWLASAQDSSSLTRNGVMSFTAGAPSRVVVPGHPAFDSPVGTIAFWMNAQNPATNGPNTLFARSAAKDGLLIVQNADGSIQAQTGAQPTLPLPNSTPLYGWHHVAVAYNQTNGLMNVYVDGAMVNGGMLPTWSWQTGQELDLGSCDNANYLPFNGMLADFRVYSDMLTDSDIATIYSSGAIANAAALSLWLNFQAPPMAGAELQWQATDVILQSAPSAQGTFRDQPKVSSPYDAAAQGGMKFYRYRGHAPQTVQSNPYWM